MAFANVLLVAGSANFSTRDVWDGYRIALESQGVRVIPYPTFSFIKVLSVDAVCNDILGTALDSENGIDCVVFVDGLYFRGPRARIPMSLRRAGLPTVLIATDDPYETIPNLESLYTYRFTNEIRSAVEGAVYLPTATLPLPQIPRTKHPRYDISFLGTVFEDRLPILLEVARLCEQEGLRFLIAGKLPAGSDTFAPFPCTEIRSGTVNLADKLEIYSQSRLTLNLFRQSETAADSPSPRVFEVTAFGHAALLSGPKRSEVVREYEDSVYHFETTPESILATIREALGDDEVRFAKVDRARKITLARHLYEHRAAALVAEVRSAEDAKSTLKAGEQQIAWIIGCGRTGSTWLAEMLGDLPRIRRWHEPYFGRFFQHINERPEERERRASFFFKRHEPIWIDGLRELFFRMVRERYPQFGRHGLVVKEVNAPEFYPWIQRVFPGVRLILLVRDPYDVLDSYLDLQRPGSWNQTFAADSEDADKKAAKVRIAATHIRHTMHSSLQTYDSFPVDQRIWLTYEQLLEDAGTCLQACAKLLSIEVDAETAQDVVDKHSFSRYEKRHTGPLQFRRRGQAGGWKDSDNFGPDVLGIAQAELGPLRRRLGYPDEP
ncbi:MAG: glycosyltransferase family protein [Planctomycetaceae bacterium]